MVEDQHGAISGSLCSDSIWSKTNMKLSSGHCAPSSNGPGPAWSYLWIIVPCLKMVQDQHGAIAGSLFLVFRGSKINMKLSLGLCALSSEGPRSTWDYRWVVVPCLKMVQDQHKAIVGSLFLVFRGSKTNMKLSLGLCALSSEGPRPTWSYLWVIVPCLKMVQDQHQAIAGSLCLVYRWSKTIMKLSLGLCALSTDGPRPSWSYRWVFVPCLKMVQDQHEAIAGSLCLVLRWSKTNMKLSLGLCTLSSDGPGPPWRIIVSCLHIVQGQHQAIAGSSCLSSDVPQGQHKAIAGPLFPVFRWSRASMKLSLGHCALLLDGRRPTWSYRWVIVPCFQMIQSQHEAISGSLCLSSEVQGQHETIAESLYLVLRWSKTNMELSLGLCSLSSEGPRPTWSYRWVFVPCLQRVQDQHEAIAGSLCLVLRWSKTNMKLSLGHCALS